jgi:hypothetical protein
MTEHQYDVFISYARRDGRDYAERLERALADARYSTWRDLRGIDPAKDFTAAIEQAIKASAFVVSCITQDVEREDSFVRREIQYALAVTKPVIVARFENITPPIHVINHTWVEFHKGWAAAFNYLCEILQKSPDEYAHTALPPGATDPFRPYLERLLKRTAEYFESQIFLSSPMDLQSVSAPDAVSATSQSSLTHDVFDQVFFAQGITRTPTGAPGETTRFAHFIGAFNYYDGRVLLLGEPGAGKTVTLMAYARDAAAKRLSDPKAPLPLFGLIASWDAQKQTPLHEWFALSHPDLVAEILHNEIVAGRTLLLLDGLDELGSEREDPSTKEWFDPRQRFMDAIPPNNHVVISCRVKDYATIGQKVALNGAVTLQPLNDEQIHNYLRAMPDLWAALEADPHLRDVARTPLVLSLLADGYRDQGLSGEKQQQLRDLRRSPGDLRDRIFEQYVHGRYEREQRRANADLPFELERLYDVLGRVAMMNAADEVRLTSRNLVEDNVLERVDFLATMDERHVASFVELAVRLHLLAPHDRGTFRFVHLMLRGHFAFGHALTCLHDPDWQFRRSAAVALGRLGDTRAVTTLLDVLHDPDARVRRNSATALGRLEDPHAVGPLIATLRDKNMWVRRDAALALSKFDDVHTIEPLLTALGDRAAVVRASAAFALGEARETSAVMPLIHALKDRNQDVRSESAQALGKIRDTRAVQPLIAVLQDRKADVRGNAADALRRIGTSEARSALESWQSETRKLYWKFRRSRGKTTE